MNAVTNMPGRAASLNVLPLDTHDARELICDGVPARIVLDGNACNLRITRAGSAVFYTHS